MPGSARPWWLLRAFFFLMAKGAGSPDGGRPTFGVHGAELRHLNVGRIDEAPFRHLTELIELPFKRTSKQA